ncbi:hypothetical protein Cflav_PD2858 [Pedosphaera parvula Ellin514]|uniref:Uncharacterized protein n=2 Tax=Pedosphaera TaxID=1032526 RepID=B9XK28_PEDPL|nr:hypothetical protein Cflav_PD2858 [Pedosphaera parvula Ellin514]
MELTRALTTIENARMEWNAARLKFSILSGKAMEEGAESGGGRSQAKSLFANQSFVQLCKLGLALTWPLALVASLAFAALLVILSQHH